MGYYELDFQMHYFMNYSRDEIENMYPYERDILLGLFQRQKEHEKEEAEKNNN
jgi:hypothetical protein